MAEAGAADSDGDGVMEYGGQPMSYELLISDSDETLAELLKAYLEKSASN